MCTKTKSAAVANHSGAMEADTISKNVRNSKRQMTSIKCKLIKIAAVFFAVLCMAQKARADDAITIRDYINGKHPTGDLVATYSLSYNTVTVTGTVGAAPSTSDYLTLNIDYGVTVIWEANLSGTPSGNYALININGGSGTFEMRSGGIENTGDGRAITNNSTCAVNILAGTVSATSSSAIYNALTGLITVSGSETRITNASTVYETRATICLANSGSATTARLVVTGGTVENTTTYTGNNYTIYNGSTGAVDISGGTVNSLGGRAIYNANSSGTVNISGGSVSATSGAAIYNISGTVNVSGGTISATTGNALHTSATTNISGSAIITSTNIDTWLLGAGTILFYSGTLNINGGTVENTATNTDCRAIHSYYSSGMLNVRGGIVKSENGTAIYSYYSITINISGGTVSGRRAVYSDNMGSKTVRITGGTVEATQSDGYAIYHESNPTLILGGNPTITGRIFTFPEKFSVLTDGDDIFAPGQTYVLDYPAAQYVVSKIAVTDGWNYLDHFVLYNPDYALITSSTHLAIAAAYRVTFNLNGGTGTLPANVSIPQGSYIKVKPPTSEYSRPGYTSDGEWWYGSPAGAAVFVFGEGGTPVLQNTTLFLMWTPETYTITYYLDGGTNHPSNPANYTAESDDIILQSPTKDGFAFGGWFDSNTYENQVTSIPLGSSENRTLWAKWMPFYTITFDATGGTVIPATGLTGDFGRLESLPEPTREDYNFNGWFTATAGGYEVTESTEFTADATIYAQWTPIYTVTFDAAGGSVNPASSATGADMTLASLPTPARNGYIFNGWFSAATGGDAITVNTAFTANTTIYAQWTLITYTITFNANGGTVTPASGTTGEGWTLPSLPVPTRSGNIFVGWFTSLTDGEEVTENTVFVANVTIYARWAPVYTITFNANGGSVTPSTGTTGADMTLSFLPEPQRNGYTFNGWFTATTGGTEVTESTVFNSNTTIYAQWTLITFTVTFEANGGAVNPAFGTTGVGGTLASLPTPTRTGYTFNGWFTEPNDGTRVTTSTSFSTDATIYAQWTLITYTVTFNANGGAVNPTSGTTGEGGTLAILPTPTRANYDFAGWFTATTGGVAITESTVFSANTTIFAQWIQITSTPEIEPTKPLRAWQHNGLLHVTGITPGETLSIYSLSGALVYQNIATSDETDISLKVKGVYILKAGDKTIKVTFE